jgi:hypothetical protein
MPPYHVLVLAPIIWAIWIIPLYMILGRIGFAKGWAFVALFPPLGLILIWVIAFARWRITDARGQQPTG